MKGAKIFDGGLNLDTTDYRINRGFHIPSVPIIIGTPDAVAVTLLRVFPRQFFFQGVRYENPDCVLNAVGVRFQI